MNISSINDLKVGMEIYEKITFTEENMRVFAELAADSAPVHHDTEFAKSQGYRDCLVFGFLVASRFSGLLGNKLPGPHTVLQTVQWKNVRPVYAGETITYRVSVKQIAVSVKAVILDLQAQNEQGEIVLTGVSQCGFRN